MKKNKEIVFILGSGRSGTTMVRDMVGNSAGVFVLPEMGFYDRYWSGRRLIGSIKKKRNALRYVTYLLHTCGDPLMKKYLYKESEVREKMSRRRFSNEHEFFREFMEAFSNNDCSMILEKTPGHLMFSEIIINNFPDAKFIHVIRNPVDSVNSWVARGDLRGVASVVASDWVYSNTQIEKFKPRLKDRILTVRYEDIVSDPEKQARLLCDFLALDFSDAMLKVGSNSSFHQEKSGIIFSSNAKRFVMQPAEIERVKRITKNLAGLYGYRHEMQSATFCAARDNFGVFLRKIRYQVSLIGIRPFRALFAKY